MVKNKTMMLGTETSFKNDHPKVMLDAQDLLLFLLESDENEPEEVTKYRQSLAEAIASIIKNPIGIKGKN